MSDLICYSHLRWQFVFQRPQHLMVRAAGSRRVWYVEEPVIEAGTAWLRRTSGGEGVTVCTPVLPPGLDPEASRRAIRGLLGRLARSEAIERPVAWLYTPLMLPLVDAVEPCAVVYDCMDELSAFRDAPVELLFQERALFATAHLVFTGGYSLYQAKRGYHARVHLFPSSVDVGHFARARAPRHLVEPADLAGLARPRLGWIGVIDERMDLPLLAEVTRLRPAWSWILVGPTVKIDPARVPDAPNIHKLGPRAYDALPAYLAHWDVAVMPFALNEATRFISPTKTPEYLAAGLPVVSTPVRDVVRAYGKRGLVEIADTPRAFVEACERALAERASGDRGRQVRADASLAESSWDSTWAEMDRLLNEVSEPVSDERAAP